MFKNLHFKMLIGFSAYAFAMSFIYLSIGLRFSTGQVGISISLLFSALGFFAGITAGAIRSINRRLDRAGIADDPQFPTSNDRATNQVAEQANVRYQTMKQPKCLLVGGLVAMGFDATGKYLLTVTHSGRGVFSTDTWERVARDTALAYPTDGRAVGIGPIDGQLISVIERDESRDRIEIQTPDGRFRLVGESDGVTVI